MTTLSTVPSPGFSDPTRQAQTNFRAIVDALAHPTRSYPLNGPTHPPAGLGRGLAAVALTILDEDCTVWLGGALADDAEVSAWLAFHTGACQVSAAVQADFAFVRPIAAPALSMLRLGTDEAPHLSTTLVLDLREFADDMVPKDAHFRATGPGINGETAFDAAWATTFPDFGRQWAANVAMFPCGVDLLLVDEERVSALPRTTRLVAESVPTAASTGGTTVNGQEA
jgi:alpha-D-ribose 1-methylphosphonate 5-triphosphate synthase subunit PhnH